MDRQPDLREPLDGHDAADAVIVAGFAASHPQQHVIELKPGGFSARVIQHGRHPRHARRMENPDTHAIKVGWCGEVMEMYLRLDGDRIREATFWADGCLSTMACGDMLTDMVEGQTLAAAAAVTPEALIAALDGLPFKNHHCAELAVATLREALDGREGG